MNTKALGVTPLQREYLNFITRYIGKHEYSPTLQEIADHFDCTVGNVSLKMKELKFRNCIDYAPGKARSIVVKD